MARAASASETSTPAASARWVALDVARCLALLGMVATHVLEARGPDGELTTLQWLAGGRASALFAVLAGVSMALVSGRRTPVSGGDRLRVSVGLALRAVCVALLGLVLGGLDTQVAIILTYYGVLFVLALPFLGLRARSLLVLAVVWAVAAPVVSMLVRPELPPRQFSSPATDQLADPARLLGELLLTGYYPAVPWLAYVLLGLAIGRLDLGDRLVQLRLALGGLVTAAGAVVVSGAMAREAGFTAGELEEISTGMFGQTPTGDWSWLLVVAPHSTTPFDLLQTGGSAALVIGALLLLVGVLEPGAQRVVSVLFGAGTMTLTLYTLHVVMRTDAVWPDETADSFVWHVLVLLWVGAAFAALRWRGPLEWLVGLVPRAIR